MNKIVIQSVLTACLALAPVATAQAAFISWTQDTFTTSDTASSVVQGPDAYSAYEAGWNVAGGSTTVNGVLFQPASVASGMTPGTTVAGPNGVAITHFDDDLTATIQSGAGNNTFTDTGLNALMTSIGLANNFGDWTVRLTGLTVGQEYSVQFLIDQNLGGTLSMQYVFVDGLTNPASPVINGRGGEPDSLTALFVADAPTQDFLLNPASGGIPFLNAVSVLSVPEPGTAALLAIGTGLVLTRHRKQTA